SEEVPGAEAAHYEERDFDARHPHVRDAKGHIRIEDRTQLAGDDETSVLKEAAGGGVHPGVGNHYPEYGKRAPKGHHAGCEKMEARGNPLPAEYHDAKEGRFEHECHGGLKTQHVAEEVSAGD